MGLSGLDINIGESVFLLCGIIVGGIFCSLLFLQCCKCTVDGRAERKCDEEYQRILTRRQTELQIPQAKYYEEGVSNSPMYAQLQPGTPGGEHFALSAPPKSNAQTSPYIHKSPGASGWNRLSEFSPSIRGNNNNMPVHAAQSKSFMEMSELQSGSFMEFKNWNNVENHGTCFNFAYQDEENLGYTVKHMTSNNGDLVRVSSSRMKLVDLVKMENTSLHSSLDFGFERRQSEL